MRTSGRSIRLEVLLMPSAAAVTGRGGTLARILVAEISARLGPGGVLPAAQSPLLFRPRDQMSE